MAVIRLFVYGSLMPGQGNHGQVADAVIESRPAKVEGRLHLRPDGYPVLWVPHLAGLHPGSRSLAADLLLQEPLAEPVPGGGCTVSGALLELDPDRIGLEALDRFEGYVPRGPSEYRRVLVPVYPARGGARRAWTYVCTADQEAADMFGWPTVESWPPPGAPPPEPYTGSLPV